MIVVDTSVLVPGFLETPLSPTAQQAMQRDRTWIVPPLWRYEFVNVIVTLLRAGSVSYASASDAFDDARSALSRLEVPVDQLEVVRVALHYDICGYDAQYIALAIAYGCQCLTADRQLRRRVPEFTVAFAP